MVEIDIERVGRIAREARAFMEPLWADWRRDTGEALQEGQALSRGMCRLATCFSTQVLNIEMPEAEWQWVGGSPVDDGAVDLEYGTPGGYHDRAAGVWHGHYWSVDSGFEIIVETTGDQFGVEPVWVGSEDFRDRADRIARCRYRENYIDDAVDEHMENVGYRVAQWLAAWQRTHPPGWSAAPHPNDPTAR